MGKKKGFYKKLFPFSYGFFRNIFTFSKNFNYSFRAQGQNSGSSHNFFRRYYFRFLRILTKFLSHDFASSNLASPLWLPSPPLLAEDNMIGNFFTGFNWGVSARAELTSCPPHFFASPAVHEFNIFTQTRWTIVSGWRWWRSSTHKLLWVLWRCSRVLWWRGVEWPTTLPPPGGGVGPCCDVCYNKTVNLKYFKFVKSRLVCGLCCIKFMERNNFLVAVVFWRIAALVPNFIERFVTNRLNFADQVLSLANNNYLACTQRFA